MAKINARGATEIARLVGEMHASTGDYSATFVLTSDGRMLRKFAGPGESYSVIGKIKDPAQRTAEMLARYARLIGYTLAEGK